MQALNIEEIVLLIEKLYSNSVDSTAIAQIQAQLQSIQRQNNALVLADELLDPQKQYSVLCRFFGALTYTVKLNQLFSTWGKTVISADENDLQQQQDESDEDIQKYTVLNQLLLNHLAHLNGLLNEYLNNKVNNLFVIKKVFSNLSLIYSYNYKIWVNPLLTLLQLINSFSAPANLQSLSMSTTSIPDAGKQLVESVQQNPQPKISLVFLFSQIIIEDILKKNTMNDKVKEELHLAMKAELFVSTGVFINYLFELNINQLTVVQSNSLIYPSTMVDSVKCFSAWTSYISFSQLNSTERFDLDTTLNLFLSFLLAHTTTEQLGNDSELIEVIIDLFTNLLETYANLVHSELKQSLNNLIFQSWGMNYLNYLGTDEEGPVRDFSRLIVAYLELDMVRISTLLIKEDCNYIFDALIKLSNFPGIPVLEEQISKDFTEFWLETSDYLIDDSDSMLILLKTPENLSLFRQKFKQLLIQLSQVYWNKIQLPIHSESSMKDIEIFKDEYSSYRRDISDLFETIYPIIKDTIFKTLFDNITNNLSEAVNAGGPTAKAISEIEASLYIINSLLGAVTEDNVSKDIKSNLVSLFSNSGFLEFSLASNNSYLMTTTVNFLTCIHFFYKLSYGTEFLNPVLDYLFNLLSLSATGSLSFPKTFELLVARAICHICNDCRSSLTSSLPKFETILVEVISTINFNSFTREKIINSVAFIIQGIKVPDTQAIYISKLLELLTSQSDKLIKEIKSMTVAVVANEAEVEKFNVILEYLLSLINCLGEIGKGMQLPEESSIFYNDEERNAVSAYWRADVLGVHDKILKLISDYSLDALLTDIFITHYHNANGTINNMINYHNQITEKCCAIFRSGLCEDLEGPFVFDNDIILNYVVSKFDDITQRIACSPNQITSQSMAITQLFNLFETVIASNYRNLSREIVSKTVFKLFVKEHVMIHQDVDLFASALKFITVILEKKPDLFLHINEYTDGGIDSVKLILDSCLTILKLSNEKFVIKCAVNFWTVLVSLKAGNKENHDFISNLFINSSLGQNLTNVTFSALLVATRSNSELYCDIVRNLVGKYPLQFKTWMRTALMLINQLRVYAGKLALPDIEVFIQKIYLTKASRKTNNVIKNYWLAANGLIDF